MALHQLAVCLFLAYTRVPLPAEQVSCHEVMPCKTLTSRLGGTQVGLQYLPMQGSPPVVRSGMYYLPSGYKSAVLPVVVVFHGLAGNGSTALAQNWVVRT